MSAAITSLFSSCPKRGTYSMIFRRASLLKHPNRKMNILQRYYHSAHLRLSAPRTQITTAMRQPNPIFGTRTYSLFPSQYQQIVYESSTTSKLMFSSSAGNDDDDKKSSWRPTDLWNNRKERKEKEKLMEQLQLMSSKDTWTISDFAKEVSETANSFVSKIPLVSSSKEVTMAKQAHENLEGIIKVMGPNATIDDLLNMNKKEKLMAANEGQTTVENINILVNQFDSIATTQQVLRKRKLEGKPLPEDNKELQKVLQLEAKHVMSKSQKEKQMKKMREYQAKTFKRGRR